MFLHDTPHHDEPPFGDRSMKARPNFRPSLGVQTRDWIPIWKSGCPTTLKQGGDSKGTDRNRNDLSIQALKRWFYA